MIERKANSVRRNGEWISIINHINMLITTTVSTMIHGTDVAN